MMLTLNREKSVVATASKSHGHSQWRYHLVICHSLQDEEGALSKCTQSAHDFSHLFLEALVTATSQLQN